MIKSERTAKLAEQCNNLLLKSENYNRRHIIAKRIVLGFFCLFFFVLYYYIIGFAFIIRGVSQMVGEGLNVYKTPVRIKREPQK